MTKSVTTKSLAERAAGLLKRTLASEAFTIDRARVDLAEEIYLALKREGISQSALAERMNKSRQYVSQVLAGEENLCIETVAKIARALNCSVEVKLVRRSYQTIQTEAVHSEKAQRIFTQSGPANRERSMIVSYNLSAQVPSEPLTKWEPALSS